MQEALNGMTDGHCAYCDSFPIATGRKELDHFKPKREFPELACEWSNLYLACSGCNGKKLAEWNEALLRADDPAYNFDRYFEIDAFTGRLQANRHATPEDQHRANESIRVFGLARDELNIARWKLIMNPDPCPREWRAYRFLSP